MRNPRAHPGRVLGVTKAEYLARRAEITAYLDLNDNKQEIPEADIRAALTIAVSNDLWAQLASDLGLR